MVKAGESIRGARVDKVSADGVLISQGKIALVVPLAPSPFLLRRHAGLQKQAGPPAVIIAPRQYTEPPPFLGNQPAAPAPVKKTPAKAPPAKAEPDPDPDPEPAKAPPAKAEPTRAPPTSVLLSLSKLRQEVSSLLAARAPYKASLKASRGILLEEIGAGSLPHRLGLRSGDTLVSLGGKALLNQEAAADAYLDLVPGSEVDLVVVRQGGDEEVVVKVQVGS